MEQPKSEEVPTTAPEAAPMAPAAPAAKPGPTNKTWLIVAVVAVVAVVVIAAIVLGTGMLNSDDGDDGDDGGNGADRDLGAAERRLSRVQHGHVRHGCDHEADVQGCHRHHGHDKHDNNDVRLPAELWTSRRSPRAVRTGEISTSPTPTRGDYTVKGQGDLFHIDQLGLQDLQALSGGP